MNESRICEEVKHLVYQVVTDARNDSRAAHYRERKAVKQVLSTALGRKPTKEEVDSCSPW